MVHQHHDVLGLGADGGHVHWSAGTQNKIKIRFSEHLTDNHVCFFTKIFGGDDGINELKYGQKVLTLLQWLFTHINISVNVMYGVT